MHVSTDQERSSPRRFLKSIYETCISSIRYLFRFDRRAMARQIGLEDSNESNAILLKYISVITAQRKLSVFDIIPFTTAIYEGDEYEKFMERLDARIKNHDRDIERMCNFHYQGFIDSIRELLQVRTKAQKLKNEVQLTNDDLQQSAKKVIHKAEELVKHRRIQYNISCAIDNLNLCQPVLEMYFKLLHQMKEKRYYPALKILEQLEHTYLPRISRYRFAQTMKSTIPVHREKIKEASKSDLNDFLENVRRISPMIGEKAMKHQSEQSTVDVDFKWKNKKRKAPPPPNPFTGEIEQFPDENGLDDGEDLSAQDMIDFSPVYRCLHIHTVLGEREAFEQYYRNQRKQQAKLALQPSTNMSETIDGYRTYFCGIIGFFVVEDHVLNTGNGLVNRTYLDEVWSNALSKIVASLRTPSDCSTDTSLMLQLKYLIMLFSYTLRSYGYPVNQLFDLLLEIRDQYNEILMRKWNKIFRKIFDSDNYHPIEVEDQDAYDVIINRFPYHDEELMLASFPKKFPFSQFVPEVYDQVKEFISACLKFSQDLNLSLTEVQDMVRKSTNLLLTTTLSGCLSNLIKNSNLGLLQLIQITINTNHLEQASVYLEDYISTVTGSVTNSFHVAKLQSCSMFKDARADAESQIYEKLNEKIDEFLELANYDWLLNEPEGQASSYLTDLIAFLKSTFEAFTNLPDKVAQTACMSSCKHIANALMGFLLDKEVKHISIGALQQFNLDVMQCEFFANCVPVHDFEEGILLMCFSELRQLLDLFTDWDWSNYFREYGQDTSKYLRVNPQTAIILLEKIREADKKKNIFSALKKNERDKKKLLETVLKQLRQLTTNGIS
ncbi:exocyst complex component 6B [Trichonephila inaurata madagascariensis]|uniref:Exocyst complex component n=1 Tax=Trichonephila inaurata madagascariensis TaxID=2747483 RepID=A0A8X6XRU6_9ARAC|nr:exocyst complex component 6B [Trichonephila inaurata madagascariensis]